MIGFTPTGCGPPSTDKTVIDVRAGSPPQVHCAVETDAFWKDTARDVIVLHVEGTVFKEHTARQRTRCVLSHATKALVDPERRV